MAIQNILPDPTNKITDAGNSDSTGSTGPGFSSVKVRSVQPIMRTRTNGGILTSRSQMYQSWEIDIKYNPLTEEEFLPIYNFLLEKEVSLKPFKVKLPQYSGNVDRSIVTHTYGAGERQLTIAGDAVAANNPKPGDLFTIADSTKTHHTKAYKIVRVETASDTYDDSSNDTAPAPTNNERRITFIPPLRESVSGSGKEVVLSNPLIQVVSKGKATEYNITKDNLYRLSVKFEEAQY